jgi:hypothetical protein
VICADPTDKYFLQLVRGLFRWVPPDAVGPEGADIVLFQASQNLNFVPAARGLAAHVWRRVREGGGRVVFDASMEGKAHTPDGSLSLHGLLDHAGAPADRAIYVTQDRRYEADYAGWCAANGVERRMKVVVYDYWLRRTVGTHEAAGAEKFQRRLKAFRARPRQRERRFLSLNFTPRPARLVFLLRLMREGLWDQGFISFGGFDQMVRRKGKSFQKIREDFLALPGFEDENRSLLPLLQELASKGQFLLGPMPAEARHRHGVAVQDKAIGEVGRSWFSVVTETEMLDRPCRITEKPLKPLLNFHPFMVFGNPGALRMIRELGFVTFPELFDEAYDEEPEPRRRFELAFAQLRRLCAMDEPELARLEAAISEKLVFNAEHGLTRLPAIYRDEIDMAVMKQILAPCGEWAGAAAGAIE